MRLERFGQRGWMHMDSLHLCRRRADGTGRTSTGEEEGREWQRLAERRGEERRGEERRGEERAEAGERREERGDRGEARQEGGERRGGREGGRGDLMCSPAREAVGTDQRKADGESEEREGYNQPQERAPCTGAVPLSRLTESPLFLSPSRCSVPPPFLTRSCKAERMKTSILSLSLSPSLCATLPLVLSALLPLAADTLALLCFFRLRRKANAATGWSKNGSRSSRPGSTLMRRPRAGSDTEIHLLRCRKLKRSGATRGPPTIRKSSCFLGEV